MCEESVALTYAAAQLDSALDVGVKLYLKTLENPTYPPIQAALSFTPTRDGEKAVQYIAPSDASHFNTPQAVDFPILISSNILPLFKRHIVKTKTCPTDATCDEVSERVGDSLTTSSSLTRKELSSLPNETIALLMVFTPQNSALVNRRRRELQLQCSMMESSKALTTQLQLCLKEFVLLDILLCRYLKLDTLWEYRRWLVSFMFSKNIVSVTNEKDRRVSVAMFMKQEDQLFFFATDHYLMNYNAWSYRRDLLRYLSLIHKLDLVIYESTCSVELECQKIIRFLQTHNRDTSAASYLLFLLHEQERRERADASKDNEMFATCKSLVMKSYTAGLESTGPPFPPLTVVEKTTPCVVQQRNINREAAFSSVKMWQLLMTFSQAEIRKHCEKGHESIWYLRLGLISWAVRTSQRESILSDWLVANEMEWVRTYVDLYQGNSDKTLLSPISCTSEAWVEAFGSLAWTSYNAARYGLELVKLLSM